MSTYRRYETHATVPGRDPVLVSTFGYSIEEALRAAHKMYQEDLGMKYYRITEIFQCAKL